MYIFNAITLISLNLKRLFVIVTLVLYAPLSISACGNTNLSIQSVEPAKEYPASIAKKAATLASSQASLLILGDSIVHGWQDVWREQSFANRSIALGASGDRIENLLWRLDRLSFNDNIDTIIVMIATNNVADQEPCQIAISILTVVKELKTKRPNAKILVTSVLPKGKSLLSFLDKIQRTNAAIKELSTSNSFLFVDTFGEVYDQCRNMEHCYLYRDDVHPNQEGYRVIGKLLSSAMSKY